MIQKYYENGIVEVIEKSSKNENLPDAVKYWSSKMREKGWDYWCFTIDWTGNKQTEWEVLGIAKDRVTARDLAMTLYADYHHISKSFVTCDGYRVV